MSPRGVLGGPGLGSSGEGGQRFSLSMGPQEGTTALYRLEGEKKRARGGYEGDGWSWGGRSPFFSSFLHGRGPGRGQQGEEGAQGLLQGHWEGKKLSLATSRQQPPAHPSRGTLGLIN